MTSVWPALWPPWKRTTTSARSLSQSTILPLPSSPHWAPITATLAIALVLQTRKRLPGPRCRRGVSLDSTKAAAGRRGKQCSTCGVTASFRERHKPDRLAIVGASHKMRLQPEVRGGHGQSDPSESEACASQVEGQVEVQVHAQVQAQVQAQAQA